MRGDKLLSNSCQNKQTDPGNSHLPSGPYLQNLLKWQMPQSIVLKPFTEIPVYLIDLWLSELTM